MRIALVTATPASVALGSGTHVAHENLRLGLEQLGHDVRVIQPRWRPGSGTSALRRFWFNARLDRQSVADRDVVCGFDLDGVRVAGRHGPPFVAYLHGVIADEARFEHGPVRWSLALQATAERWAARRADLVLATSEYSRRRIGHLYGVSLRRIQVVPPAFDLARWARAGDASPPVSTGRPTVLCVGRMYPRKNHAGLLQAAALVRDQVPGLAVRIVGDGPERRRLERLATRLGLDGVARFTGQVGFDELAREYAGCDVFCLPTLQEGFGLVFAEAMTAGKPVVACRAGSVPELVTPGCGVLVDPGDTGALAGALIALLGDPERRHRLGRAGRAEARRRFGLERGAGDFLAAVGPLAACQEPAPAQ